MRFCVGVHLDVKLCLLCEQHASSIDFNLSNTTQVKDDCDAKSAGITDIVCNERELEILGCSYYCSVVNGVPQCSCPEGKVAQLV